MGYKKVSEILIGKDVSSGEGFLRVLDQNMAALAPGSTIADSPIIYIEQTLAGGTNKLISLPIHGLEVANYSGRSAAAAVLQVTTVGTANVISGQEYGLYITLTSDKELSQGNRRYYFQYVADSSATALEIATGMAASINSTLVLGHKVLPVTAAVVGTTMTITADNPTVYFTVGKAMGYDSSVTVTLTAAPDPGQGTYDQIFALEDIAKGYKGYLGERRTFVGDPTMGYSRPTYFTTGVPLAITGVYDQYVIDHNQPIQLQGINSAHANPTCTVIAVVAGSSTFGQANFEAILNPWMASCPGAFDAVNL